MKIIIDAMGGDHAPKEIVLGALQAAEEYKTEIVLVGRGEDVLNAMRAGAGTPCRPVWRSPTRRMWSTCTPIRPRSSSSTGRRPWCSA